MTGLLNVLRDLHEYNKIINSHIVENIFSYLDLHFFRVTFLK